MNGNEDFRDQLRELLFGEIRFAEPASRHTSLGVGGPIDALVFPESEKELLALVRFLTGSGTPFLPVGNWTNLVVTDRGYRGVLVSLRQLTGLRQSEREGGTVLLEAQAGVPLSQIVQYSLERSLTGMEFCAGIPGSVGGAVRMNAGAYGGDIKDVVTALRLLDPPDQVRTEAAEMLNFAYRSLDLPAKTIIIGAVFRLHRGDGERIGEILAARREKHPLAFRNAGSVFKNPRDIPAGRLIEAAGLKGIRVGDAQVSEQHANFIINRGAATATDIVNLIDLIQRRVFAATGQRLETEVKIIGT
jgi:UDP-N-acetylmuramate dehydrogenase